MSNELSSAEVTADPPIDLEILTAAWAATTGCGIDQIRAALVAALPALRRQIAEEIAEALEERRESFDWSRDRKGGLTTAACIAREIGGEA